MPEDVFIEELEFYEMDESIISEFKQKEGFVVERREMPSSDWQRFVWQLCEEPGSSLSARAFAAVSVSSIIVSIVNFCTETIPVFAERPICINVTDMDGRTRQVSNFRTAALHEPCVDVETANNTAAREHETTNASLR